MSGFPCRACGSAQTSRHYTIRGWEVLRCARCSSLTTGYALDVPEAQAFYGDGYFSGGDYDDYQANEVTIKRNFARFVERLRQLQPEGKLLEIGCAYGYFLDLAQAHWRVTGVDISVPATAACRRRFPGSIHCGDLLTLPLDASGYDWIVAWDTVEHLDRPRDYLARCRELLRPDGRLALTTGDVSSSMARLLGPRWRLLTPPSHLTFFSRAGIDRALRDAGYDRISIDTAGYERTLAFAAFRLLGERVYGSLCRRYPRLARFLAEHSFYLDLGDIMWVMARRPGT